MFVPREAHEITAEWLTAALRGRGLLAHGAVSAVRFEGAGGLRGFAGQVLRLRLTFAGDAGGVPASMVAKLPAVGRFGDALTVGAYAAYANEIRWYEQCSARCPVRTPQLYWAGMAADDGRYCLLIEDLQRLNEADPVAGMTRGQAEVAVTWLARLHAACWGDEQSLACTFEGAGSAEDRAAAASESVRYGWDAFAEAFGEQLPPALLAAGPELASMLSRLPREIVDAPRTLIHGDYKVENLLFGARGSPEELVAIDWQGASPGFGAEDLARLLSVSLGVERRRAIQDHLLGLYHRTLSACGVSGYGYAKLQRDYRAALLLEWGRAIGGFRSGMEGQFSAGAGATPADAERLQQAVEAAIRLSMNRRIAAVVDCDALEVLSALS